MKGRLSKTGFTTSLPIYLFLHISIRSTYTVGFPTFLTGSTTDVLNLIVYLMVYSFLPSSSHVTLSMQNRSTTSTNIYKAI